MRATPRFVAHWPWFALATVLLLLGTASWMSLRQNFDEDLKLTRESSGRELHVLAAFISVELQAGRYQDIERLLRDWGKTNSSIAHLQLVSANGFVLATYQRPGNVEHALTLEQPISYSYRGEATLRLRIDLADVYRHQQRLATEFAIILAVGAMLLSLLVFVALQRQREAARLRQRTQELDAATHALAKSEERLKLALEASSDGLWDWGVQANTAHFSPRWKAILGYADDELADSFETWYQRLHPEDQPRARAAQQAHFDDPARAYEPEYRMRHKNGDWVWIQSRGKVVERDAAGRPRRMVGTITDITARKRAQQALEQTEQRFRALLENLELIAVMLDHEGNIILCNDFLLRLTGWQREEILHRSWFDIFLPPDIRDQVKKSVFLEIIAAGSAPIYYENEIITRSGERRLIAWNNTVFRDPRGQVLSTASIGEDITERRRVEELKEASVMQLHAIVNASPVPQALNDEHQNITFLNPAFTGTFGYTREDIPTLADWWPKAYPDPEYRQWVADTWQATLDKARRDNMAFTPIELNVRSKDGTVKTVLVSASPIGKSFEGVHLVVLYDITERKHAEAERERLLAELTAANVEMENFVYTISHDLKSPLITIGGFASLVEKDIAKLDGEAAADSIVEIKKAVADMQGLIENLLQLARLGHVAGEAREVDINALLDELRARCARQIKQKHATIRIAPDIPRLWVDPVRLGEVLQNLVDNALKYHRPGVPPEIEIGWRHEGEWFRLYVRDNGIGFKKEYQERIFELFQRLDSHTDGTGVGLTISRRIIESHGGHLTAESEPGQGSTFWIALPESVMVKQGAQVSTRDIHLQG
ncbi:MAG: PAS domain S-box protein [Sulfuricaulis sp.]|uniref:PAS domain S-box protein n=1 Tax=Sulfuricaulis sp. TaxID=2003553 RepID=UPI003C38DA19